MQVFNWGGIWAVKQVPRQWKKYFILSYMYLILSLSSLSIEVKKFHIRLLGDIVDMKYNLLEKMHWPFQKMVLKWFVNYADENVGIQVTCTIILSHNLPFFTIENQCLCIDVFDNIHKFLQR